SPQKVLMRNVVRIQDGAPQLIPGAKPYAEETAPAAPLNLFTFKKGVGSQAVDPTDLSPQAQQAFQRLQAAQNPSTQAPNGPQLQGAPQPGARAEAPSVPTAPATGFPNGIKDGLDEPMSQA